MKKLYFILCIVQLLCMKNVHAQNIAINDNGALPDTTAMLDVTSTTKGFLTPRMTAAQRNAILSPAQGLMVYCTTDSSFYYYSNGWNRLVKANESWGVNGNAGTDPAKHFIGTTDGAALHFRLANENAGFMNTSRNNTALGRHTLDSISDLAAQTTAVGADALKNAYASYQNTAIGTAAGYGLTWGSGNTFIGSGADVLSPMLYGVTAIGAGAKVDQDNSVVLGTSGTRVGFGVSKPVTALCNTDSNITGADGIGIRGRSITWNIKTQGYIAALQNKDDIAGANGLAVKIANATPSGSILDLSTGQYNTLPGKTVLVVRGSGNVGINKISPIQKLDLNGNMALNDSVILLRQGGDSNHYVKWSPDVDGPKISGYAGGALSGRNGNILYWRSDNKVGILNASPQQALDVAGKATIRDSLGIGIASPTAQLQLGNTTQNRKIVLYSDAVNDHQFYGFGINAAALRYQVSSTSSHVFYASTSSSSSNELFRIRGTGRIGVAQTNPICLMTNSDSNSVGSDGVGLSGASFSWIINDQGYVQSLFNGEAGSGRNGLSIKTAGTTAGNTILDLSTGSFATGVGTSVMVVRGNGNVGINNIAPLQKLDVKGKAIISDSLGIGVTSPTAQLHLGNTIQNRKIVLYNDLINDHQFYGLGINPSTLRFQVPDNLSNYVFYSGLSANSSAELLRINGNGYVGFGISNPITRLSNTSINIMGSDGYGINTGSITWDMNMAGYVQGLYNQSSAIGSNGLAVKIAGNTASNIVLDLSTGAQAATGTSIMQVRGNGNVSIGTTASTEKLSVNGAVKITDGGYGSLTNNAISPVPSGGAGTMVFSNNHFFGWNGTSWKQLDN